MKKIVALAGGVGGAKLALGLYRALQQGLVTGKTNIESLTIIGNTGDDLELFGVRICPDLDTVLYTLAGLANPATGWGIEGDTFATFDMLKRYGEDTWFWLGDRDFATHLIRTQMLRDGKRLTEATARLAQGLGLNCQLLPMCDADVRTLVQTKEAGELAFQEYFVRRHATDTVTGLRFAGAEAARLNAEVSGAIAAADLIVVCPSNPYLSIWPILAVPGMKEALSATGVPIIVVSPIVGGKALKGPAAAIMHTLGGEQAASALGVARIYAGWADGFVLDSSDAAQKSKIEALGFKTLLTNTIMNNVEDKTRLASEIVAYF
jgi:LPPG:FO 2-phospho-L-lactate transferase